MSEQNNIKGYFERLEQGDMVDLPKSLLSKSEDLVIGSEITEAGLPPVYPLQTGQGLLSQTAFLKDEAPRTHIPITVEDWMKAFKESDYVIYSDSPSNLEEFTSSFLKLIADATSALNNEDYLKFLTSVKEVIKHE